jgi:esterase/lipase superfamily enzyme
VFIHGYNVSFDEAVLRTGQLAWDLKFAGPAITYSWPSADRTRRYISDLEMAEWSAPHLQAFLQDLRTRTRPRTIHLIAHSMGARVLTRALERLVSSSRAPDSTTVFQEVVLAAPDMNAQIFTQLAPALRSGSNRVTIYSSARDLALRVSAAIRGEAPRVGGDVTARAFRGFDVIDGTRIGSSLLNHSTFAEDPLLLNDLALLFRQRLGPDERSISLERSGDVWVFRP